MQGWHKFDPASQEHKSDLDWNKLTFSAEQAAKFSEYVKSTRVRAARNISGLSLPAGYGQEPPSVDGHLGDSSRATLNPSTLRAPPDQVGR